MAGNNPRKNNEPDSDPKLFESTIKPADPQLGPVEPLDTADDGLVLTDEGLNAPPGVGAPGGSAAQTGPVPGLVPTSFDLGLPPAAASENAEAAVGGPDPTGPSAGWYDSSARLPRSVPPPDHPPSQSSLDIDVDAAFSRLSQSGDPPSTQQIDYNPPRQPPAAGSSVDFSTLPPVKTPQPAEDYSASDSSIDIDISPAPKPPSQPKSGSSVEVEMGPAVKTPKPVQPGSEADIDLPPVPRSGEEPSDIFSTARRPSGSDAIGGTSASATGGSDVLADAPWGDKLPGSDLFGPRSPAAGMMGPSSLDQPGFGGMSEPSSADDFGFGTMTGPSSVDEPSGVSGSSSVDQPGVSGLESSVFDQRGVAPTDSGSSVFDEDVIPTDEGEDPNLVRTEPNIALPGDDDPSAISGFDKVEKSDSSSDLFGDATVVDMNLLADAGGSGVNLHESTARIDEGAELSSIFSGTDQPAAGRVDLSDVPVGGEWADRTEAMTQPIEPPAPSSIFGSADPEPGSDAQHVSFDLPGRDDGTDYQDSANINWSSESGRGDLIETAMEVHSGADEMGVADSDVALGAAKPAAGAKSGDEESVFAMPAIKAPIDSGLSDRLDAAVAAGVPVAPASKRPDKPGGVSLATKRQPKPPTIPEFTETSGAGKKQRGWLVGALGLLLGAGAGAGGMYLASDRSPSQQSLPGFVPSVQPVAQVDAQQIGLDPAAALLALERAGQDTPTVRAGRGQARWLARVRAAASRGQALTADDEELAKAQADLRGVFASSADLTTPEDQAAGLRAALHLGLIHEVLGDPAAARRVYEEARAKLPFAPVFQSAIDRVRLMEKDAAGTVRKQYSLVTPSQAADLAEAVLLLNFPPVQENLNIEDEPAYHFWRAINFSVNAQESGAFKSAQDAINRARQLHESRRKAMIGMGLNPLSDPSEQAFVRVCEELALYWDLKRKLYESPVAGPIARKLGADRTLDDLIAAKRDAGAGTAPAAEVEKLRTRVASLANDLNTERTNSTKLIAANKQLTDERQKATASFEKAQTELGVKTKEAETAKNALADADRKLKEAEAAVDAAVVKMKEAKLIDAALGQAAARAALPDALKKAVLVTGGDTAAAALTAALDKAHKEKDASEKKARDAEAALRTAREDAEKKAAELDALTRKADERVAAAVKQATDAAAAESKRYEDRLAAQAEQFRGQLAAVRSGAVVPLADVERAAIDRARRLYGSGLEAYRARQYAAAEAAFADAVETDPADARYWYYLGVAKFAQGKVEAARADFQKGADWEGRNKPGRRQVGEALLLVQGAARAALDTYR